MQFQVLTPLDLPDWNTSLTPSLGESIFNTVEWARTLYDTYGYSPCYLASMEGDRRSILLPMMEVDSWLTGRRGVSLPFSDFCAPIGLNADNWGPVIRELVNLGRRRKWRYFEIRTDRSASDGVPRSAHYLRHSLDLTLGEKESFDRLGSSVRTSIRKAVKSGVEVTFSDSLDSVRNFYRLNCETRRRHGLPPQPFRFFKNLHQHVLVKGMGCVVTAWHGGGTIAADVFLHTGREALYKYGASDTKSQHLRASNLLMWEAIRHYARGGYQRLSMGRTAKSHSGLRRFKLGWGAQEDEMGYIKYDLRRGEFETKRFSSSESGYEIARRLPICVLQWGGMALYRHIA